MNHKTNYLILLLVLFLSLPLCAQEDKGEEYMEKANACLQSEDEEERSNFALYVMLAAEEGNTEAQSIAGKLLLVTEDEENYPKAVEYLQKAAAKNEPYAMNWLADCYENGYGVSKDLEMATFWRDKAKLYMDDEEDAEDKTSILDPVKGKKYLEKAMELLKSDNEDDMESAVAYLVLAAEEDNSDAQFILGYIILENEIDSSYDMAFEYLQKAADKGFAESMLLLAECYEHGKGVEKDIVKAKSWRDKANALSPPVEYYFYTAQTTFDVNFREGPSTAHKIIRKLPKGTDLFVDKSELSNGYYKVLNVSDDEYGYVHQKYVKFFEKVKIEEGGGMKVVQTINSPYAVINILNDTDIKTTVKIGKQAYIFTPHQKRSIQIDGGTYTTTISSPGVKAFVCKDVVKGGIEYEWTIYIVSH